MKRIDVIYDGQTYSIGHRSLDEVEDQIVEALKSGVPSFLEVDYGEGAPRKAKLLIHTGIGIGLIPVDPDDELPPEYAYDLDYDTPADGHELL